MAVCYYRGGFMGMDTNVALLLAFVVLTVAPLLLLCLLRLTRPSLTQLCPLMAMLWQHWQTKESVSRQSSPNRRSSKFPSPRFRLFLVVILPLWFPVPLHFPL